MKESNENSLIIDDMNIQNKIYTIRGFQVMLDSDLAQLYGVETKRINEAVKNNPDKFPDDFYFELTEKEFENLRSKISTANLQSLFCQSLKYIHAEIFQDCFLPLHLFF